MSSSKRRIGGIEYRIVRISSGKWEIRKNGEGYISWSTLTPTGRERHWKRKVNAIKFLDKIERMTLSKRRADKKRWQSYVR